MNWSIEKKLIASVTLVGLLATATGVGFYVESRAFVNDIASLQATNDRARYLRRVLSTLQDAETGQRGYIITGRTIYLEPYDAALSDIEENLADLRDAYRDRQEHKHQITVIEQGVRAKLGELARTVELRKTEGFAAAQAIVLDDSGKRTMDRLRSIISQMLAVENTAQRYEGQMTQLRAERTMGFWLAGALVVVGIIGSAVALVLREVRENRRLSQQLQHDANHDHLTGLPNRAFFMETLIHTLARASREQTKAAVLFMDLNGFKPINDQLGHEVGDLALIEVARQFRSAVRSSDFVARLGGDEFVVLVPRVETDGEDDLAVLVRKLEDAAGRVSLPVMQGRKLGTSVGLAVYPEDGLGTDALMAAADHAMYAAKAKGKQMMMAATYRPAAPPTVTPVE